MVPAILAEPVVVELGGLRPHGQSAGRHRLLLHEEKELHIIAAESKHWHLSSQRFAAIRTALLVQTLFVEYRFGRTANNEND
jgi:hypothetical protein